MTDAELDALLIELGSDYDELVDCICDIGDAIVADEPASDKETIVDTLLKFITKKDRDQIEVMIVSPPERNRFSGDDSVMDEWFTWAYDIKREIARSITPEKVTEYFRNKSKQDLVGESLAIERIVSV